MQPLEQVKSTIEKKLIEQRANQLAAEAGRRQLEELRQGKATNIAWTAPQLVSRTDTKGMSEPLLRQVFKADAQKLPSYTGVEAPDGGYMLLRISRIVDSSKIDRTQQNSLSEGLAQMIGQEQFGAYVENLKAKQKVRINKERFEKAPS
jgi:peptidyl-prolyl cis-trans isomerase D